MDYILQKSTELGVDEIHIYEAVRSKIKLDGEKYNKKVNRVKKQEISFVISCFVFCMELFILDILIVIQTFGLIFRFAG